MCPQPRVCNTPKKTIPKYECKSTRQCKTNRVCCEHGCYTHKVCVKPAPPVSPIDTCPTMLACPISPITDTDVECWKNDECENDSKCCPHPCYTHKVCLRRTAELRSTKVKTSNSCVIENKKCTLVPYFLSKHMICTNNEECPAGFYCCQDACYSHRICKKGYLDSPELINPEEPNPLCPVLEENCSEYSPFRRGFPQCDSSRKCGLSEACCPSRCVGHNICVPIERQEKKQCPKEDKCNRKHGIKLAKKHKCNTDVDCANNQLCCFDVCVNFKICKHLWSNFHAIHNIL